jgi:hypothetical protein
MYYTYAHYTADTNELFYIGKGKNYRHQKGQGRNRLWTNIARKHGWYSRILAEWPCEEQAYQHEEVLIACFRGMGVRLANLHDGGSPKGSRYIREFGEQISKTKRVKGKPTVSPELLEQRRAQCRKNAENQRGKPRKDPEYINKIQGRRWITNGEQSRWADTQQGLPEGWSFGRTFKPESLERCLRTLKQNQNSFAPIQQKDKQ